MRIDLNEKVALVTGSAQRVGRYIALELAKQGVHIQVHYHSADADVVRSICHLVCNLAMRDKMKVCVAYPR